MPTNVPPQYREAEERFRQAGTTQARIAALQEMLSIMPKHKGTDHLKAQLRSRRSKLTAELEGATAGRSGGRTEPFSLPKEGGGRATLVGPTNVGKSLLMVRATGARARVGAYALSTQEPVPGMLPYKDLRIQLVDTPPISNPGTQSRLYGLLRSTDVFVVVVDLSMDAVAQTRKVFTALQEWGFRMLPRDEEAEDPWKDKATITRFTSRSRSARQDGRCAGARSMTTWRKGVRFLAKKSAGNGRTGLHLQVPDTVTSHRSAMPTGFPQLATNAAPAAEKPLFSINRPLQN